MDLSETVKSFRVSLIILSLMGLMLGVSLIEIPFFYTVMVVILVYEYFVMLGGTLNWLNFRIDDNFKGTGLYRRLLAADAKLMLFAVFVTLWLSYWHYLIDYDALMATLGGSPQMTEFRCFVAMSIPEYFNYLTSGKVPWTETPINLHEAHTHFIPVSVLIAIVKLFLLGQITHSIHHLILNERIAGMRSARLPLFTNLVSKAMKWARG